NGVVARGEVVRVAGEGHVHRDHAVVGVVATGDDTRLRAIRIQRERERKRLPREHTRRATTYRRSIDQVEGAPFVVVAPATPVRDPLGELDEVLREVQRREPPRASGSCGERGPCRSGG